MSVERDSSTILFIGSAVSVFEPSSLPMGQVMTELILDSLGSWDQESYVKLKSHLKNCPFEVLFDTAPSNMIPKLALFLAGIYNNDLVKPNFAHKTIAWLISNKKIKSVITTNYDKLIEKCDPSIKVISAEKQWVKYGTNYPFVLKLHGDANDFSSNVSGLPAFRLSQEYVLDKWKIDAIRVTCEGSRLIILGYSGYDFDICIHFKNVKLKDLIWFGRSEEPNPKQKEILQACNENDIAAIYKKEDLRSVLAKSCKQYRLELLNLSVPQKSIIDVKRNFEKIFDLPLRKIWYSNLITSLGFRKDGKKLWCKIKDDVDLFNYNDLMQLSLASCAFDQGEFLRAYEINNYLTKRAHDGKIKILCRISKLEALREGGYFFRFMLEYWKTRKVINTSTNRLVILRWIMLKSHFWIMVFTLFNDPITKLIASYYLRQSSRIANDIQEAECQIQSARHSQLLGISFKLIEPWGGDLVKINSMYEHYYYPLARLIANRYLVIRYLKIKDIDNAQKAVERIGYLLKDVDCLPELFKYDILRAKIAKKKMDYISYVTLHRKIKKGYGSLQYSPLRKAIFTLMIKLDLFSTL